MNSLSKDKNSFFDQLQLRQAEIESSQSHLESLRNQNAELQFQIRESNDRIGLLTEELVDVRRDQESTMRAPSTSAQDLARHLAAAEAKYEMKLADLRRSLASVERERDEGEADWSQKLREKARETDELKKALASFSNIREQHEEVVSGLKAEIARLTAEVQLGQNQLAGMRLQTEKIKEAEVRSAPH